MFSTKILIYLAFWFPEHGKLGNKSQQLQKILLYVSEKVSINVSPVTLLVNNYLATLPLIVSIKTETISDTYNRNCLVVEACSNFLCLGNQNVKVHVVNLIV